MSAFSEALAAALRELLSSTLGVPEEGMRDTPLPELVRALQREWEALLEGLVRSCGAGGEGDGCCGPSLPYFSFFCAFCGSFFPPGVPLDARAAPHAGKNPMRSPTYT